MRDMLYGADLSVLPSLGLSHLCMCRNGCCTYALKPDCLSRPRTECTYLPNFIRFGIFRRPWKAQKIYRFSTLSFSGGSAQRCRDKVERGCTSTNISLSNDIKVFSNSKVFMAKWRSQTLLFESVTEKQKSHTQTISIEHFRPLAARDIRAPLNLA